MHCTTVATVDGFQGNERDIIAISPVRSGGGSIGFAGDAQRLNVAITRARHHAWIVGNFETLETGFAVHGVREKEGPNVWKQLLPFVRARGWVMEVQPRPRGVPCAEAVNSWMQESCREGPMDRAS